jgi:hypothetical protein
MTSVKVCTAEWMLSDPRGMEFGREWMPRIVSERFLTSGMDGVIERTPDPLPMIEGDLVWTNSTPSDQHLIAVLLRAPRSLVTSSPNTVVMDDAVSWDVGVSPNAPLPAASRSGIGGRMKNTRATTKKIAFGRVFMDRDDAVSYYDLGPVYPDRTAHFRYRCLLSTPGEWRTPNQNRHEAYARWARLMFLASPMLSGV